MLNSQLPRNNIGSRSMLSNLKSLKDECEHKPTPVWLNLAMVILPSVLPVVADRLLEFILVRKEQARQEKEKSATSSKASSPPSSNKEKDSKDLEDDDDGEEEEKD